MPGPLRTDPPGADGLTARLSDGTPVLIRPVTPCDAGALRAGFAELSPRSRAFRFLRPVAALSETEIAGFTHPDHVAHEAIGALDTGVTPPHPAGIAHYYRLPDDHALAEFALTIVDAYQVRGLGTLLLGRLARLAASRGIDQFAALVHRENAAMLHLLDGLGAAQSRRGGADVELTFRVHADPALYPQGRAGDAFRAAYALGEAAPSALPPGAVWAAE